MEEPVVARRAEQTRAHAPVRRPAQLAPGRDVERRAVDVLEAVLAHHAGRVDDLGREDARVVAVPGAVPPREREVLDQQAALGVLHASLRNLERRAAGELGRPERRERLPRREVAVLVERERRRRRGIDEPRCVHGFARARRDDVRDRRPSNPRALADDHVRLQATGDRAVAGDRQMSSRRGEGELHGVIDVRRVGRQTDEADERARDADARGEGLLRVADAAGVDVVRLECGQVTREEPRRRKAGEAASVALAAPRPDGDRQLRAVRPARIDRAAVRDVERDRLGAELRRPGERKVVDARVADAASAPARRVEQRCELPRDAVVRRPLRRPQQRLSPDVAS